MGPQQIKKQLLTKWCLDETPPQPQSNSLDSSEEDRTSGDVEENTFIGPLLPLDGNAKEETSIPILELGHPAAEEDPGKLRNQNRKTLTDVEPVDDNESQ